GPESALPRPDYVPLLPNLSGPSNRLRGRRRARPGQREGLRSCHSPFSSRNAAEQSLSVCARNVLLSMLTNKQSEDRAQQHEDQGLHQAHEQFHEIKRNRQQPPEAGNHPGHGFQHVFPGKDVAVETEAQGDRPEDDGNYLQAAGGEEHDDHQHLHQATAGALGCEQLFEETTRTDFLHSPDNPTGEEHESMASVKLRSAFAPRKSGRSTTKTSAV